MRAVVLLSAAVVVAVGLIVAGRWIGGRNGTLSLDHLPGVAIGIAANPTPLPGSPFPPAAQGTPGQLRPGSDPSALASPVLIADRNNNRLVVVDPEGRVIWQFPEPGDLQSGQQFIVPDDAFFTPDGKQIIATHESDFVVTLIDIASRRIVWQYGDPGIPGAGPNRLWNPDDAVILPNRDVVIADIKNCRVLVIHQGQHSAFQSFGSVGECYHNPPQQFGSPNGAFPMRNGDYLITEINGDWVDEMTPDGKVIFSVHPPGISYPSDANEVSNNQYLIADYSRPGTLEIFDRSGNAAWVYRPSGKDALNHPSLAMPLPDGKVISTDDLNHRVIVVDPSSNQIVWQYGETGIPGNRPGLLNNPDGLDLAPPNSLLIRVDGGSGG